MRVRKNIFVDIIQVIIAGITRCLQIQNGLELQMSPVACQIDVKNGLRAVTIIVLQRDDNGAQHPAEWQQFRRVIGVRGQQFYWFVEREIFVERKIGTLIVILHERRLKLTLCQLMTSLKAGL
ncbi:MAG: hypothetical protein DCC73_12530 [Proteobacteria bacterium]|nr:MAG: hypothetical protein DCC73_12530 [Pseudomonadota bacterium]